MMKDHHHHHHETGYDVATSVRGHSLVFRLSGVELNVDLVRAEDVGVKLDG